VGAEGWSHGGCRAEDGDGREMEVLIAGMLNAIALYRERAVLNSGLDMSMRY
jgi:hypothetical protein